MAARTNTANRTYAEKTGREPPAPSVGGKPIFIKHKDIPLIEEKVMTNEDMYKCLLGSAPRCEIKGVQRIGGLWRLYIETQEMRIKLITKGVNIRNANVAIYDTNPFLVNGKENTLRLLIKDVPLSAHNSLIIDELEKLKHKVVGSVIYQRLRVDGQLTECLTGDRIVYIQQPPTHLPRNMSFGIFKARVFHFGQIPASTRSTVVCSNCLTEGHHRSTCSSPTVCRRCKQPGHLQQQCSFETPPTSPKSDRASENTPASAASTVPPEVAIEQLISAGRQNIRPVQSASSIDNQTRAQAKITQFLRGDRDASQRPPINNDLNSAPPPAEPDAPVSAAESADKPDSTQETSSDDTFSDDDGAEISEISVESPELPKQRTKGNKVKLQKRKQKATQRNPKKK